MHLIPAMVSFLALVVAACVLLVDVDAAPQQHTYDTFIKTNLSRNHHPSRHNNMNDHPDHAHRTGPHRHMSSTVMTTTGALRGLKKTVLEKDVHLFYGVPFAKPPLGPLRFKKVRISKLELSKFFVIMFYSRICKNVENGVSLTSKYELCLFFN